MVHKFLVGPITSDALKTEEVPRGGGGGGERKRGRLNTDTETEPWSSGAGCCAAVPLALR